MLLRSLFSRTGVELMQPDFPPVLALFAGLLAAALFTSALTHWMALLHATLAKHGGSFLGPPGRRLLLAAPLVVLLHPVPYLLIGLLVISGLAAFGAVTRGWWWFLAPFYVYVAFTAVMVGRLSPFTRGTIRAPETSRQVWPFDVLQRRRYQGEYRAAFALFLVHGTLAKLPEAQQADITNRVTRLLLQSGVDAYAYPPRSPYFTLVYAAQMNALGIPPALEGEQWPLPEKFTLPVLDPNTWSNSWRIAPPKAIRRLLWNGLRVWKVNRRGGEAVDHARRDIIARGLDIAPIVSAL